MTHYKFGAQKKRIFLNCPRRNCLPDSCPPTTAPTLQLSAEPSYQPLTAKLPEPILFGFWGPQGASLSSDESFPLSPL